MSKPENENHLRQDNKNQRHKYPVSDKDTMYLSQAPVSVETPYAEAFLFIVAFVKKPFHRTLVLTRKQQLHSLFKN